MYSQEDPYLLAAQFNYTLSQSAEQRRWTGWLDGAQMTFLTSLSPFICSPSVQGPKLAAVMAEASLLFVCLKVWIPQHFPAAHRGEDELLRTISEQNIFPVQQQFMWQQMIFILLVVVRWMDGQRLLADALVSNCESLRQGLFAAQAF